MLNPQIGERYLWKSDWTIDVIEVIEAGDNCYSCEILASPIEQRIGRRDCIFFFKNISFYTLLRNQDKPL
jgi:hypothetical protein